MSRTLRLALATTAVGVVAAAGIVTGQPSDAAPKTATPNTIKKLERELLDHSKSADLLIASHRGLWRDYPENSLAAIDRAIREGAEVVEIDVQQTKDGVLVLMHDDTVDRTTNGTGRVSDLTFAQVRALRLREGLGGNAARVTGHQVPTLKEVMKLVKGRALVNLDKGWGNRELMLEVLRDTGTVNQGLFKSESLSEASAFLAAHPDVHYMHIIGDKNPQDAFEFPGRQPVAFEVTFDAEDDVQAQPDYLRRVGEIGRIWVNTMWGSLAAGNTDEASLRLDPDFNWDHVVNHYGASMIQTDNVAALDYWRDGGKLKDWDRLPGKKTVRIEAEDATDSYDTDVNKCAAVSPESLRLDICDQRGARVVGWIRGGEWIEYDVEVPLAGTYEVTARVSSPYDPAGTVNFTWDGQPGATFGVGNTTSHNAFERQAVETRSFAKGTHTLRIEMPAGPYQNFNLDYIQLDRVDARH